MGFFDFIKSRSISNNELPSLFPLSIQLDCFVENDIIAVYTKILTDCIERTQGIPKEVVPLLWDNCLQSEASEGLVTLVATAMAKKQDLFLVYVKSINLLRKATNEESSKIREDYKTQGKSDVGVYVSFTQYRRTDMVKIYSSMEYCVVASLNKMMNLSKSIQFKMNDMRASVGLTDSPVATDQAIAIAQGLANGKDVMLDGKDTIFTNAPDISSIKESISFLDSKKCFYYSMPLSYVNGEQTTGIGTTGEADTKAVERGLKQYYISVIKPVIEALFEITTSFKTADFRQITSALDALKAFELVGEDMISLENKRIIISRLFEIELDEMGDLGKRAEIPLTTASVRS